MKLKKTLKKKILIVDDDRELCDEIKEILESHGCMVDNVYNLKEAEDRLRLETYNFVLLDLKIPGGGFAALKKIRLSKKSPKVVVITGSNIASEGFIEKYKADKEARQVFSLSEKVMRKPFSVEDLLSVVK